MLSLIHKEKHCFGEIQTRSFIKLKNFIKEKRLYIIIWEEYHIVSYQCFQCPLRWKLNYIDKVTESEPSIHLLFGTAMHEVIQTWLEVMYHDSVKNANKLNLEQRLHDKMMELFKQDKEEYGKNLVH